MRADDRAPSGERAAERRRAQTMRDALQHPRHLTVDADTALDLAHREAQGETDFDWQEPPTPPPGAALGWYFAHDPRARALRRARGLALLDDEEAPW